MKLFGLFVAVTVAKDIAPAETTNTDLGAAVETVADEVVVADDAEAVVDENGERGKKNKYGANNYDGHHDHGNYNHGHHHNNYNHHNHNHNYDNHHNGYNGGHHNHNGYQGHHSHQSHHTHTHTTTTSHHHHPQNQYNNNHYNNDDGYNNDGYNAQYEQASYNDNYELPCLVPEYGIKCWTCNGKSIGECARTGYTTTCRNSQTSCSIELRKNHGYVSGVQMGCKAPDACWKNKAYNFGKNPECHPERNWGPSVCRQCCQNGDNCLGDGDGYHFDGVLHETKHDWDMDLMNQCETYEEETYEEETYEAPYETPYEDDGYGNTNLGY